MKRLYRLAAVAVLVTGYGMPGPVAAQELTGTRLASTASPCGQPPAREAASLSFDGESLVLVGGDDYEGHIFQDQWRWTSRCWRRDGGSPIPPGRDGPASVWDGRAHAVVLAGGTFPNSGVNPAVGRVTWVRTHGRWVAHHPVHVPPDMPEAGMVYDPDMRRVLLIGDGVDPAEHENREQVWSWDGHDWQDRAAEWSPPGRFGAAVVYDPASHEVLVFGGHRGLPDELGDTWAFDGASWRQLHPTTVPTAGDAVAATDTTHKRAVLVTDDGASWTWTGSDWRRLRSPQSPPSGLFAAMSDDPVEAGVALITGKTSRVGRETLPGELWLWDGQRWTRVSQAQ